ncbi:hypothetical protein F3Y22_tig00109987pilonHSYRG00172 [Hibiscus syriacus]|uniref:C2H2-type domain-containing protein n=1 Tax=Hibiscus syriacus TaxID=106335 RepID=A0A6A3BQP7_HIBSY|nr:uncharacterized protein LOC120211974 [Hibiscus syriacus]KAE8718894.1 hypothetical protein F3Y22_tig00109987pilonHSYRG00172 [Hibiscus syriacus]
MDFKFRAIDDPPPSTPSSSSGQALRPESNVILSRTEDVELEKLQIREEIIALEVGRRRAIEAEVRTELMMVEWEMAALHRVRETGLSYDPRLPLVPHFHGLHRWRPDVRFNSFPTPPQPTVLQHPVVFPPPLTEVLDAEVKDSSEEKNKLIKLAKPDPNRVVGEKRKTPPLAETAEPPQPLISSKVKQNELSCPICLTTATSEKALAEHLGGKKHKAKEAMQKAQKTEKSFDDSTDTETSRKKLKCSDEKLEDNEKIKNEKNEHLIKKEEEMESFTEKKIADSLEKKHAPTVVDEVEKTPEVSKMKKFKFWCEICSIGVHSEVVMETHKKGRKHTDRLLEIGKSKAATLSTASTDTVTEQANSTDDEMPKVADVVSVEKTPELIKKKFKFWCEICSIGAHSEVVMVTHEKGRKHMARLQEIGKSKVTDLVTATTEQATSTDAKSRSCGF